MALTDNVLWLLLSKNTLFKGTTMLNTIFNKKLKKYMYIKLYIVCLYYFVTASWSVVYCVVIAIWSVVYVSFQTAFIAKEKGQYKNSSYM